MRETTNLKSGGEKRRKGSNKLASVALAGALLGPVTGQAQEVKLQEKEIDKREIKTQTTVDHQANSTITRNDAVKLQEKKGNKAITQEEIQEYINNHKGEIMKEISRIKTDENVRELIYKELMNNEDIKSIIEIMVNDKYVKEAVLGGDNAYIQERLKNRMHDRFDTGGFLEVLGWISVWDFVILMIKGIVRTTHGLSFFVEKRGKWYER